MHRRRTVAMIWFGAMACQHGVQPARPTEPAPAAPTDTTREAEDKRIVTAARDQADANALVLTIGSGAQAQRLVVATGHTECEVLGDGLDAIDGAKDRLVLAMSLCEHGEDEFSRSIAAALIDVGHGSQPARVLWEGTGTYRNSFGVCEHIDVPEVHVTGPGTAEMVRYTEVIARPNPQGLGGEGCVAEPAQRRTIVEVRF